MFHSLGGTIVTIYFPKGTQQQPNHLI